MHKIMEQVGNTEFTGSITAYTTTVTCQALHYVQILVSPRNKHYIYIYIYITNLKRDSF